MNATPTHPDAAKAVNPLGGRSLTGWRLGLITSFGLGYLRPASGTWGSLPPAAAALALALLGYAGSWWWYAVLAGFLVVFSWACVAQGDAAEAKFGRKDPGQVVADETAGMALVLIMVPPSQFDAPRAAVAWVGLAFVLWRVADIVKPWPANSLQRVRGGWGILLDDLVAACYVGLLLLALGWVG